MPFPPSRSRALAVALGATLGVAPSPVTLKSQAPADSVAREVVSDSVTDAFGRRQPRRTRGASVATIDSLPAAGAGSTLADLLTARLPGVSVWRPSGAAGAGVQVRLRGPESFARGTPLLIVDGILANANPRALLFDVGGDAPSRLDDLSLEDVEHVEVLRGPAAAALYGLGATAGAIVVTTRRGGVHPFRWRSFAQGGGGADPKDYPDLYGRTGVTASGAPIARCTVFQQARGDCTPNALLREGALEGESPIRAGARLAAGARGDGALMGVPVALSAALDNETNVLLANDQRRLSARLSAHPRFGSADLRLFGSFVGRDVSLPAGGLLNASVLQHAFVRDITAASRPPLDLFAAQAVHQDADRRLIGAVLAWRPRSGVELRATAGEDDVESNERRGRNSSFYVGPDGSSWGVDRGQLREKMTTLSADLSARYGGPAGWRGATIVGVQRRSERTTGRTHAFDEAFAQQYSRRSRIAGLLVHQEVDWRDRLFVSAGLRGDDHAYSAAGTQWSPAVEAAWSFDRALFAAPLRLRAAYGDAPAGYEAGNSALAPYPLDPAYTATLPGQDVRFQRTSEMEVGADAGSADGRASASITLYRQQSRKLLAMVPQPPSSGYFVALANVGALTNEGLEAQLRARVVDGSAFHLEAGLAGSFTRSEVTSLEQANWLILGRAGSVEARAGEGDAPGALWDYPYQFADADGDGLADASEISYGTEPVYLGNALPTRELSLDLTASMGRLAFGALLDHRGGHQRVNATGGIRCALAVCRGVYDPSTPLAEQAAALSAFNTGYSFVDDGDFTRLRELWIAVDAPAVWAGALGAGSLRLTVSGRNLVTFSDYSGLDPEVTAYDEVGLGIGEALTQPLPRVVSARIDIGW